jgi:hypothetical protein
MPRISSFPQGLVLATAIGLIAMLSGCAHPPEVKDDYAPGVRLSLKEAMDSVDKQKQATAAAQETANLGSPRMTVVWEGEGAEILSRIAVAQKLKFKITGPQPRLQLPVFVKLKDVTLVEAIQAIGEQFGQRADAVLTDDTIELRMRLY